MHVGHSRPATSQRGPRIEQPTDKPGLLNAYATMTLIDGILNLLLAVGCCAYFGLFGVATMGLGLICVPLSIYPLVVGILELVQWGPLNSTPPRRGNLPTWLAIMQLINVLFMNPLSLACGIIGLIAGNDAKVKAYLQGQ